MRTTPAAAEPHARSLDALREGADELVETYGELLHEGLEVVRDNVATLWGARAPLAAVEALPEVIRRSYRFSARCLTLPSRVALDCATRMLAPFGVERGPPEPKK